MPDADWIINMLWHLWSIDCNAANYCLQLMLLKGIIVQRSILPLIVYWCNTCYSCLHSALIHYVLCRLAKKRLILVHYNVLQTLFVHSHLALKLKYVRPAKLYKLFLSREYNGIIMIIYNCSVWARVNFKCK